MATRRSNGEHWPEEMVNEILLRLPIKSIFRFKCVAKTWHDLFENPTFIPQHDSLSKRNTRLLVRQGRLMYLFDDETLVPYYCGPSPQLPHRIAYWYGFGFCVDNGLVCLWDKKNSGISLWNPATTEFRVLPHSYENDEGLYRVFKPRGRGYHYENYGRDLYLGFGLDPMSNDYKVVCIQEDEDDDLEPPIRCVVYKMSTDSWRVMDEEQVEMLSSISCWPFSTSTCVNGVCYWLVDCYSTTKKQLLVFHLGYETFQLIQLPPGKCDGQLISSNNDRICCVCTDRGRIGDDLIWMSNGTCCVDIWMLNDDDDEGHWTKLLSIKHPPFELDNIFMVWGRRKLLASSLDENLLLWDIETNEWRDIGGDFIDEEPLEVCPYEESFVSISSKY